MTQAMTEVEKSVWMRIRDCHGRTRAVTRGHLARTCDLDDRIVRDALRSLRNVHGLLICYSTTRPGGYFIAETREELETCRNLEAAREAHVRENRIAFDNALKAAGDGQMTMEF